MIRIEFVEKEIQDREFQNTQKYSAFYIWYVKQFSMRRFHERSDRFEQDPDKTKFYGFDSTC